MAVYRTTFPIAASADTVWDVLTDFERCVAVKVRKARRGH